MSRRKKGLGIWAHGCPICGQRYESHGVLVKGPKGGFKPGAGPSEPCQTCVSGRPLAWWPESWLPKACCRQQARVARKEEYETYKLSAAYVWFICPECGRTHPRQDPTKETDDDAASRAERSRRAFRERQAASGDPDLRGQAGAHHTAGGQGREQT